MAEQYTCQQQTWVYSTVKQYCNLLKNSTKGTGSDGFQPHPHFLNDA